ncbi:MAG TPA: T9SS type A sorting domain-containing protein [Bacteroidetes bacterium]|nr:hypothetical protein BMS3Bbin04_00338 [bacterium BMS3Bbin04]HDO66460.1 T9SS type A sorting domain-containing protein [Bacteroidota bacterium]HEX05585.1 T9SS type A sorting domain-containing protein [Bacteroidota bacterium]
MRTTGILIFLVVLAASVHSQPPDTLWTRTWDRGSEEQARCINPTRDGGFILCGSTNDTPGIWASWLMRVDQSGETVWEQSWGGELSDGFSYVEQTSSGDFIGGGGTWSYSPNTTFAAHVTRVSANGNLLWSAQVSNPLGDDGTSCVREVPGGDVIAYGLLGGRPFLWRLGPDGEQRWLEQYEFDVWATWNLFVEPTSDGGFICTGLFYFDDGTGDDKLYLLKTDGNGQVEWMNRYPPLGVENVYSKGYCVRECTDGGFVVSGRNMYENVPEIYDSYLLRTDFAGNILWEQFYPGPFDARCVQEMPDGGFILTGTLRDSDGPIYDYYWIGRTDSEGELLWETTYPNGQGYSICQSRDGGIAITGERFRDNPHNSADFYMLKLEPEVALNLVPEITLVPTEGGIITYSGSMTNILTHETTLNLWASVIRSGGTGLRPLQNIPITLLPGEPITADNLTLTIPASAPDGLYRYEIHVGNYPDPMANMGLGAFTFWKGEVGVDDPSGPGYGDPGAWGDPWWPGLWGGDGSYGYDPDNPNRDSPHPGFSETGLHVVTLHAYPNPFNAVSTITLTLPQPGDVAVSVYNTLGQEVALLNDATLPAGTHSFTLDASDMASGLYFVRATVQDTRLEVSSRATNRMDQIQKIVVVK